MAAIVVDGTFDLPEFRKHVASLLPPYARPLFVRIKDRIEATATFKHTKTELVREGLRSQATSDAIYFDDPSPAGLTCCSTARVFARNSGGRDPPLVSLFLRRSAGVDRQHRAGDVARLVARAGTRPRWPHPPPRRAGERAAPQICCRCSSVKAVRHVGCQESQAPLRSR